MQCSSGSGASTAWADSFRLCTASRLQVCGLLGSLAHFSALMSEVALCRVLGAAQPRGAEVGPSHRVSGCSFLYLQTRGPACAAAAAKASSLCLWPRGEGATAGLGRGSRCSLRRPSRPDPHRPASHEPPAQPCLELPATWPGSF